MAASGPGPRACRHAGPGATASKLKDTTHRGGDRPTKRLPAIDDDDADAGGVCWNWEGIFPAERSLSREEDAMGDGPLSSATRRTPSPQDALCEGGTMGPVAGAGAPEAFMWRAPAPASLAWMEDSIVCIPAQDQLPDDAES